MGIIKSNYISLKEAAEISGYAPDYVGQLIRKGRLPGKQVFINVAWMTTEEDLKRYMAKAKSKGNSQTWTDSVRDKFEVVKSRFLLESQMAKVFKFILYLTIAMCIGFSLLLFYIISINIDKKIEQKANNTIETNQPTNAPHEPYKTL